MENFENNKTFKWIIFRCNQLYVFLVTFIENSIIEKMKMFSNVENGIKILCKRFTGPQVICWDMYIIACSRFRCEILWSCCVKLWTSNWPQITQFQSMLTIYIYATNFIHAKYIQFSCKVYSCGNSSSVYILPSFFMSSLSQNSQPNFDI